MSLQSIDYFKLIDDGSAYIVHTKNGTLLRPDKTPILFIAGEKSKYKFILRSTYLSLHRELNILLMAVNEMVTPQFTMAVRFIDMLGRSDFERDVLVCPHGSSVRSGQHFHAKIEVPPLIMTNAKSLSLKMDIGGSPVPFNVWSNDMTSITIISNNTELRLPFNSLSLKK
jgi:hypothetical protein